jgi:DNA-binding response OmpR family regulator
MKILIIEDDQQIVSLVKKSLSAESFLVESAGDGKQGILMAKTGGYSLIILDLSLPKISGQEVLKEIRKNKINLPIIILTVHSEIKNKKEAFSLGADDYLSKPFLLEELIIRIKALLRRPPEIRTERLKLGSLVFNSSNNCFKRKGQEVYLTKREYNLLLFLLKRKGEIVSKGEILEYVWNYNSSPFSNSIETHIASLRKKININKEPNLIHTFPGRGYKLSLRKIT